MTSAIQFFREHPLSLLIGTAKAYRDFFIPGDSGIFSFYGSKIKWLDLTLWITSLLFLFWGIIRSIKNIKKPIPALLLAGFIGIFFSITFLPPVDGGKRFYASTMPFFFALVAMALPTIGAKKKFWEDDKKTGIILLSGVLTLMTLIMPVIILHLTTPPEILQTSCSATQVPYTIRIDPNSSVSLTASQDAPCGASDTLCLADFEKNGVERNIDPFFQRLVQQAEELEGRTSVLTANNLVKNGGFHFFLTLTEILETIPPRTIITGCATEFTTQRRPSLYRIESVLLP